MDLNRPMRVVTPTLDGDVLSALAGAEETFTGPQLHKIIGRYTEKSVRTSLQRLCEQGVVLKEQKGPLGLYRFNREHLAATYIIGLANLKDEFLTKITKTLTHWEIKPVFAAIFGSAALGGMRLESDIDIFIVRPEKVDADDDLWCTFVSELSDSVTQWTGNDTRVFEMSESEVAKGLLAKERVLTDIREQGLRLLGDRAILQVTENTKKVSTQRGK